MDVSKEVVTRLVNVRNYRRQVEEKAVFILAGDVVYNMAHDEPSLNVLRVRL